MRLLLIALVLALAACSNPSSGQGSYVLLGDGFSVPDTGLTDLGKDATSSVPDVAGSCSCDGLKCGSPPGCSLDCGKCGDDQLCSDNQCVADPSCVCHAGQCGILPGCKGTCYSDPGKKTLCPGKQTCTKNACVATCSCAGVECGIPGEGCTKSCGECSPGLVCSANSCAADPKCECKPGQCGVLPGCAESCGGCGGGLACENNQCAVPSDPCACGKTKCGPLKVTCNQTCGLCEINQFCESNSCVTFGPEAKHKYGEPCGPGGVCQPPPANAGSFAVKKYLTCLDNSCETQRCSNGVCTKSCTLGDDTVDNASGAAGADGIEDPGAVSTCGGAVSATVGGEFHCIEQNSAFQVQQGLGDPVCQPGGKFTPCSRNADCQAGQVCRVYAVLGSLVSRCGPRAHDPSGAMAAKGSQACNENTDNGNLHLCENGLCTAQGCTDLCQGDADCATLPGQCKSGSCLSTGASCATDADCPKWKCKAGVKVSSVDDTLFSVCQP